jgi:heavy-metal-associated domain
MNADMETAYMVILWVIIVAAIAFVVWRIVQMARGKGGCGCGCCSATGSSPQKSDDTTPSGVQCRLYVNNMHCHNCERTVTTAIEQVESVHGAAADHASGLVVFRYDGREETLEKVKAKLEEVGFPFDRME